MIVAMGIVGGQGSFRVGIKADRDGLLKMPAFTAPFDWPSVELIKSTYPDEDRAADEAWCWADFSNF